MKCDWVSTGYNSYETKEYYMCSVCGSQDSIDRYNPDAKLKGANCKQTQSTQASPVVVDIVKLENPLPTVSTKCSLTNVLSDGKSNFY